MELKELPDPERIKLIPSIRYAVGRHIVRGSPDYWDYARPLELTVLAKYEETAMKSLANTLGLLCYPW